MTVRPDSLRHAPAVLLLGAVFLASAAAQGDPPPKKDKKAGATEAARPIQTRVFTPKNTEPDEVARAIEMFLERLAALKPLPPGLPLGGVPGVPGGPGLPGGMGGQGGPASETRVVVDERTGALVVRGPDNEVQIVADLVTLLDSPADKALPEVKSVRAFPLKFANASALADVATNLELRLAVLALDEAKLLLATGSAEALNELADMVKALDVPAPKPPEKRKKLFGGGQSAS